MTSFAESTFVIVGLARNCSHAIESEILRLYSAFSGAKNISCIVVESDSSDNTVQVLQSLSYKYQNFSCISLGELRKIYPLRTQRIAFCRNKYLEVLAADSKFFDIDYVVVADLDGVNSKLTNEAVKSCWVREDWDVCTANQNGPYYDIWALRHPLWSPNDCWKKVKFLQGNGATTFQSMFGAVYSKMIRIKKLASWIEVDSAFGGLAIYKKSFALNSSYVGLNERGEEVCEHVVFHRKIRDSGGRIFINPALINANIIEHARYATMPGKIFFWFGCLMRDFVYRFRSNGLIEK